MSAAEGLYLAAEFEIAADLLVGKDSVAVDNSQRSSGPGNDVFRLSSRYGAWGTAKTTASIPLSDARRSF